MKKYRFLFAIAFAMFLVLPFKVNAENALENPDMYIDDIVIGNSPKTSASISALHLDVYDVDLIWYESTDGTTYNLMDTSDTFDYNTYYKVVFDTNFTYLQDNMDEGWEFSNINLKVYDNETEVDTKTFTASDYILEYVYKPIWKYNIKYNMTGVTSEGQSEIFEGNNLYVKLTPMNGYRLPTETEVKYHNKIEVMIAGIGTKSYEYDNEAISINDEDIKGDILIKVEGIPVVKAILDANGGTINNKAQYTVEDFKNIEDFPKPIKDGYTFKGWYTEKVGGKFISDNKQISNGMTVYAHWDKKGTITIDLTNIENIEDLADNDAGFLEFLEIKGIINLEQESGKIRNKDGLLLFTIDLTNSDITLADNLTTKNNIVYNLEQTEKDNIIENGWTECPDKIELIVSNKSVYKLMFDANGGTFKNDVKIIDIEDIINFDYESFEKPTRDGYKFIGFYTNDGKSYLDIMNSEEGITEDIIFYAKWQEVSAGGGQSGIPEEENPKTFDDIGKSIIMGTISLIGLVGATIYFRKRTKIRV